MKRTFDDAVVAICIRTAARHLATPHAALSADYANYILRQALTMASVLYQEGFLSNPTRPGPPTTKLMPSDKGPEWDEDQDPDKIPF